VAAFGGLNLIRFHPDDSVSVEPVACERETLAQIQAHTLFFYTGITRSASDILQHQNIALATEKKKCDVTRKMVGLAETLYTELRKNSVASFGEIIHEGWLLKKSLTGGISNDAIDDWYQKARRAGAVGGKLLGAGAGGFLMFYAPPERHAAIETALKLRRVDFHFEPAGSRVIFVCQ
jgi:D-glycero-alpha-D-manno-heptose-7-phosphate kinase